LSRCSEDSFFLLLRRKLGSGGHNVPAILFE